MADLISSELSDDLKNSWRTDDRVYEALDAEFFFDVDVAANEKTRSVPIFTVLKIQH